MAQKEVHLICHKEDDQPAKDRNVYDLSWHSIWRQIHSPEVLQSEKITGENDHDDDEQNKTYQSKTAAHVFDKRKAMWPTAQRSAVEEFHSLDH